MEEALTRVGTAWLTGGLIPGRQPQVQTLQGAVNSTWDPMLILPLRGGGLKEAEPAQTCWLAPGDNACISLKVSSSPVTPQCSSAQLTHRFKQPDAAQGPGGQGELTLHGQLPCTTLTAPLRA